MLNRPPLTPLLIQTFKDAIARKKIKELAKLYNVCDRTIANRRARIMELFKMYNPKHKFRNIISIGMCIKKEGIKNELSVHISR